MLNRNFEALTVNGKLDMSAKNILAGSPVTLGENGYKLATSADVVAGLSVNYFCDFNDEVANGDFHADSGKIAVVKIAQVTLMADVYFDAEGVKKTVSPFAADVFEINDTVYVNADGKITKTKPADAKTALGTVVKFDDTHNVLVLDLMPVAA
ncbi:MAG: hypothetical protein NC222_06195 [Staphylococcus sp.]|nr:hypothetical protein [Staphylococcus sp.]